jgi:DNA-binding response OmpR family regulator
MEEICAAAGALLQDSEQLLPVTQKQLLKEVWAYLYCAHSLPAPRGRLHQTQGEGWSCVARLIVTEVGIGYRLMLRVHLPLDE